MNEMPLHGSRGERVRRTVSSCRPAWSPWAYNENRLAQKAFPSKRSRRKKKNLRWQTPKTQAYTPITKKAEELPDHIKDADNKILKEVIECADLQEGLQGRAL